MGLITIVLSVFIKDHLDRKTRRETQEFIRFMYPHAKAKQNEENGIEQSWEEIDNELEGHFDVSAKRAAKRHFQKYGY